MWLTVFRTLKAEREQKLKEKIQKEEESKKEEKTKGVESKPKKQVDYSLDDVPDLE